MKEFIIASGNEHKKEELGFLFKDVFSVRLAETKVPCEETGETLHENAFLKAKAYFDKFQKPTISDDSGLFVASLPGELGVRSARFGGEGLTDKGRYELLLEKLRGKKEREAYFAAVLCFYCSPQEVYFFEGKLEGHISSEASGSEGFGYDPVFMASEKPESTIANLSSWKKENSHRALAAKSAIEFFSLEKGLSSKV